MNTINFNSLVNQIQKTNEVLQGNARLVINRHVTAKAWLTGYYIVEYEQHGEDRAKYGERLLQNIADRLKDEKAFSYRTLRLYRQFYLVYPNLKSSIGQFVTTNFPIWQSPIAKLELSDNEENKIRQSMM